MKKLTEKQADFMAMFRGTVCQKRVEALFLYHSSPVLCKAKPAVLVTILPPCVPLWRNRKKAMCRASGLNMTELRSKNGSVLVLIYDQSELNNSIKNNLSLEILDKHGYKTNGSVEDFINHLSFRLSDKGFPHEVGLFLGYPPGDVKAYIENGGQNCACCRYWKAYENVGKARETWARIDEAQSYAIDILQELPPIHIAANLLKAI